MNDQERKKGDEKQDVVPVLSSKKLTLSEIIDAIGYGTFHVQLSVAAGIAFLADAMEMMILSVIAPALRCSSWGVSTTDAAFLTTSVFIAMAISSPVWGFISDAYGRQKSLVISSTLLLLFGLVTAFSPSYTWLVVLRFLCGCCISCMPQCITILLEYLPRNGRGKANIVMAMIWAFGGTFTILIAWGCIPSWLYGWRVLIVLCTSPVLMFLCFSFWVPESMLFLLKKGKVEETMCILKSIAQKNKKEEILENNQIILDKNVDDIDTTSCSKGINSKLMSHLFGPGRKKLTFLCWGICALGGFNYYGVVLFATEVMAKHEDEYTNTTSSELAVCHSLTSNDYVSLLWTSLAEYPASLISLYIMDIIGRKKTFAINSGIYSLSLFLIMTVGKYFDATALTLLLFIARGSGVSYTWVCFMYVPEAYPTEVRSIAFGIGSTFIRIGGMITPYVAQVLFEYSETLAFGVYTLMGIVGTILPMFLPIETMGLDLSLSESKTLLDNDLKPSEGAYLKSKSES